MGEGVLELGVNVVIDYGLWGRDERSALRQAAADLGAMVAMRYFELTPAEQRRRLDQRQAEAPHTTWPMSDEELAGWAANIDIPTPGELVAVKSSPVGPAVSAPCQRGVSTVPARCGRWSRGSHDASVRRKDRCCFRKGCRLGGNRFFATDWSEL